MAPAAPSSPHPPPRIDRGVQLAVLGVLALGSSGLVLAVFGLFRSTVAAAVAVGTFALLAAATRPDRRPPVAPGHREVSASAAATVALLVIALTTVFHATNHGEHLLTDRDPGVYVTTGRLLATEGELLVRHPVDPFASTGDDVRSDLGFHRIEDRPGSARAPQFAHLFPVLLAWGHWLGGATGLLLVPALLGGVALAAVWAFTARLVRPWTATAAVTALALSPLQLFFTRDAYSEPLTQLLLFGGLTGVLTAIESRSLRMGVVAGLLLGAVLQARIDGVAFLVLLPAWLALAWWSAARRRQRVAPAVVGIAIGAALGLGLGLADLWWRSPVYLDRLSGELLALLGALVVVAAVSLVVVRIAARCPDRTEAIAAVGRRIAPGLGLAVVVLALAAWFVRPHLGEVRADPSPFLAAIQQSEGSTVDPTLRYSEHSMRWLGWYLGVPALALGAGGVALAVALRAHRPRADALSLLAATAIAVTALYLWRPSISPDHLWVMRRYLVATVPATVLFGAWLVDHLTARIRGAGAAVVVLAAMGVPAALAAWPLRDASAQPGTVEAIATVCEEIGTDAAVGVIPEDNLSLVIPLALQAWCEVPVAVVTVGDGPPKWSELASQWRSEGRRLHVLARTPGVVQLAVPTAEPHVITASGAQAERTLTRPARSLEDWSLTLAVAEVAPPG